MKLCSHQLCLVVVPWLAICGAASSNVLKSSAIVNNADSLSSVVEAFLHDKGPGMAEVVKEVQGKMEMSDAMQRLKGKLPSDITALVGTQEGVATGGNVGPFDENSLKKSTQDLEQHD